MFCNSRELENRLTELQNTNLFPLGLITIDYSEPDAATPILINRNQETLEVLALDLHGEVNECYPLLKNIKKVCDNLNYRLFYSENIRHGNPFLPANAPEKRCHSFSRIGSVVILRNALLDLERQNFPSFSSLFPNPAAPLPDVWTYADQICPANAEGEQYVIRDLKSSNPEKVQNPKTIAGFTQKHLSLQTYEHRITFQGEKRIGLLQMLELYKTRGLDIEGEFQLEYATNTIDVIWTTSKVENVYLLTKAKKLQEQHEQTLCKY